MRLLELGAGGVGGRFHGEPTEVGCRGFAGKPLDRVLGLLGICELHRRRAIKKRLAAAESTSWRLLLRGGGGRDHLDRIKT